MKREHEPANAHIRFSCSHWAPFGLLLLLFSHGAARGGSAAHQDQCPLARPAILGLRCNSAAATSDEGLLSIRAHQGTEILLVGHQLDWLAGLLVALTASPGEPQSDCTHLDRGRALQVRNLSSSVAAVRLEHLATPAAGAYYLCLRPANQERWFHQGSQAWLALQLHEDLLPLYMKLIVIAVLLMVSGLFSGLNLGLMALDKNELQVIISCGSEREKRYARAIEPVRRRGNYLLCSILFANVLVNSTIAVLLEELTSGVVAIMTSTIFIVMFGEILPQAFCSRHGLAVGAKTVCITYFCMFVTFPLSYPVAYCLDWALGEEIGHAYDRERLMEFIRVTRDYNNLEADEVNIISGALKLKQVQLSEVMTRMEDVYMLDISAHLDFNTIQRVIESGYSRIPVHESSNTKNIVALLFVKDLALLNPNDKIPVQTLISFYNHPIMYLFEDTTLDLALNEFKTGKSHIAFVRCVLDEGDKDPSYEVTGIVTLEDVIEEVIQMEINDETDTLSDNRRKRRRKEAQLRADFGQFIEPTGGQSTVSSQLCLAAYQFLSTTVEPFSPVIINDSCLRRLLLRNIYYTVRLDQPEPERRIYKAGEPANYFVMLLEGRARVVCGREALAFESGPFSFFGKAALKANGAFARLPRQVSSSELSKASSSTASPRKDSSATKQSSILSRRSISMRVLEQLIESSRSGTGSQMPREGSHSSIDSLQQEAQKQLLPNATPVQAQQASAKQVALVPSDFIPDYTVELVSDAVYLKITGQEYQNALRASLAERGEQLAEREVSEELLAVRIDPKQSTSDQQ